MQPEPKTRLWKCPHCQGTGDDFGQASGKCEPCRGTGTVRVVLDKTGAERGRAVA